MLYKQQIIESLHNIHNSIKSSLIISAIELTLMAILFVCASAFNTPAIILIMFYILVIGLILANAFIILCSIFEEKESIQEKIYKSPPSPLEHPDIHNLYAAHNTKLRFETMLRGKDYTDTEIDVFHKCLDTISNNGYQIGRVVD